MSSSSPKKSKMSNGSGGNLSVWLKEMRKIMFVRYDETVSDLVQKSLKEHNLTIRGGSDVARDDVIAVINTATHRCLRLKGKAQLQVS